MVAAIPYRCINHASCEVVYGSVGISRGVKSSVLPRNRDQAAFVHAARTLLCALGILVCLALPQDAFAQASANGRPRLVVLEPLSVTKINDMDFGDVLSTTAAGTVVMDPTDNATTDPTCTTTGGLTQLNECQPAEFAGLGETNRIVRIRHQSQTITLTGPGADMTVTNPAIDASPDLQFVSGNMGSNGFSRWRIVSSDGSFVFRIGGTLNVNADQAPGVYTGTFTMQVEYQ